MAIHYKNPRKKNRTVCGHNHTIPGRTYSNVTSILNNVDCSGCLLALKDRKWFKEKMEKKGIKSPRELIDKMLQMKRMKRIKMIDNIKREG